LVSPIHANYVTGFPTTSIHVGGREVLLSDACLFHEKLSASGQKCYLNVYEGLWHGTLQNGFDKESNRMIDSIVRFINQDS
jgi:acetyl esterase/lipase